MIRKKFFIALFVLGITLNNAIALSKSLNSESTSLLPVDKSNSQNIAVSVKMSNLTDVDNNANDLIQLKRKLEIEKAQAEIKKVRNGGGTSIGTSSTSNNNDNAQTTVTGVAINQEGRKVAWLQFADGGSLVVNIGSKVGKYVVSDINMNGVKLSYPNGKSSKSIFLKRSYSVVNTAKNTPSSKRDFFGPSPIITDANTTNNDMVPPIVSVR